MPQITIDDKLLGGINQLLKLARSGGVQRLAQEPRERWVRFRRRLGGGYHVEDSTHSDGCDASTTRPTEPKLRRFEISSCSVSSIDAPSYAQRWPRVVQWW